jgi:hypothetical protein
VSRTDARCCSSYDKTTDSMATVGDDAEKYFRSMLMPVWQIKKPRASLTYGLPVFIPGNGMLRSTAENHQPGTIAKVVHRQKKPKLSSKSDPIDISEREVACVPRKKLSQLPAELRIEIYKHIFRGKVFAAVRFGSMLRVNRLAAEARFQDQHIINILRTSKAMRAEATPVFQQLVTVAFLEADVPIAAKALSSTLFDPAKLTQVGIVGPYSKVHLPTNISSKCPKLTTLQLTMFRSSWWEPLRVVLDPKDTKLDELVLNEPRLADLFLSIIRYDWLANGRVAEVSDQVAVEGYDGPGVMFSVPVVLQKCYGVPLRPNCDGGVSPSTVGAFKVLN